MTGVITYYHAVEHPNEFNNLLNKLSNKNNVINNNDSINNVSKFMSGDDNSKTWINLLVKIIKGLGMEPKVTDLSYDVLVNQYLLIMYCLFFLSIINLRVFFFFFNS